MPAARRACSGVPSCSRLDLLPSREQHHLPPVTAHRHSSSVGRGRLPSISSTGSPQMHSLNHPAYATPLLRSAPGRPARRQTGAPATPPADTQPRRPRGRPRRASAGHRVGPQGRRLSRGTHPLRTKARTRTAPVANAAAGASCAPSTLSSASCRPSVWKNASRSSPPTARRFVSSPACRRQLRQPVARRGNGPGRQRDHRALPPQGRGDLPLHGGAGRMRLGEPGGRHPRGRHGGHRSGVAHKLWNTGEEPLVLLCCCSPPYSHDDTVLLDT